MKFFLKSKVGNNLHRSVTLCLLSFLLVFSVSQAEDIEIYTSLTSDVTGSDSVPVTTKPNVVFIFDTSGSMDTAEASEVGRPEYISTDNYGSSGTRNTNVYLYSTEKTYLGVYVSATDNRCTTATNSFAANAPEYLDEVLTWQHKAGSTTTTTDCSDDSSTSVVDKKGFTRYEDQPHDDFNFSVAEGDQVEFLGEPKTGGWLYALYFDSNGNLLDENGNQSLQTDPYYYYLDSPCVSGYISANGQISCDLTIPANVSKVQAWFYRMDKQDKKVKATLSRVTQNCVTTTVTEPGLGNWYNEPGKREATAPSDIIDNDLVTTTFECRADTISNLNGTERYAQYQEPENTDVSIPNYVSDQRNVHAVDWTADSIDERYLIDGNFHEYLSTSTEDLLTDTTVTLVTGNLTDYCRGSGRVGRYIQDTKGNYYLCETRLQSLQRAAKNVFNSLGSDVNIGLMVFNSNYGARLVANVENLDSAHKIKLQQEVDALVTSGTTPLQSSLFTAYSYFAGNELINHQQYKVVAKRTSDGGVVLDSNGNIQTTGTSNDLTAAGGYETIGGKKYFKSPVTDQCQDNSVVLFSDGEAYIDTLHRSEIQAFAGGSCGSGDGDCLSLLASGLASKDVYTKKNPTAAEPDKSGKNNVFTYTIALGSAAAGADELRDAADKGRRAGAALSDHFYTVTNSDEIGTAFRRILKNLQAVSSDAFVSPAVAVNAFNRLQFRNDLYFAVFFS